MASTGCNQVLFNALMATIENDDEVIITTPYWPSYPAMIKLFDGKPVVIDCPRAQGFKLLPEQLDAAITSKTKWLLLNYPANPTGVVYTKEELLGLIAVLKKHPHVWIMSDEIYEHLTYEPNKLHSIAALDNQLVMCFNSQWFVKESCHDRLAVWFLWWSPRINKVMTNLQSQSTTNPCLLHKLQLQLL